MAQQTMVPPSGEVENPEPCRHHWVIQPASGPVSLGECQLCGEAREFKNYVESASWGDSRLAARSGNNSSEQIVRNVANTLEDAEE